MIYVDAVFIESNVHIDLRFDEMITVWDLVEELSEYIELNPSYTFIFSKDTGSLLDKRRSFKSLKVKGGDTLIVIENEVESIGNADMGGQK